MASARSALALPALLLRAEEPPWHETINVYVPEHPVVAFTARDLRSPHIQRAVSVARDLGFAAVVRSPGGRMVAYDGGAVVVDQVTRSHPPTVGLFEANAAAFADVLHRLSGLELRVGQLEGEYCPGEFSVNVRGVAKTVGSAQRITSAGSLFSTVVQVSVTERVRAAIERVSAVLDYPLRRSTIAGLADFAPRTTPEGVASALRDDYRHRSAAVDGEVPESITRLAGRMDDVREDVLPVRVDDWAREAVRTLITREHAGASPQERMSLPPRPRSGSDARG